MRSGVERRLDCVAIGALLGFGEEGELRSKAALARSTAALAAVRAALPQQGTIPPATGLNRRRAFCPRPASDQAEG